MGLSNERKRLGLLLALLVLAPAGARAADDLDHLRLVTYGPEANTREGDDDFVQVVLIEVPAEHPGPLRVRLFDPDAGGDLDVFYGWGSFDTATRFTLYGGPGAASAPGLRGADPAPEEIHAGSELASRAFADDPSTDRQWVTLAEVTPEQGEKIDERRVFKLVIEGVAGNDGNVFDVDVVDPDGAPVPGVRLLSYEPTIHHETKTRTAEVRILPSGNTRLFVHSFDAAGADLRIETRYRTLPADTSGQNKWSQSELELTEEEQDQMIALAFGGRAGEIPNDATLYLADENGVVVPIELPISLIVPNRRPKVVTSVRPLDCTHAELDARASSDAEGDQLAFEWRFPDGTTATAPLVTHDFGGPGSYEVRLRVTDDSGQVGSGTEVIVPVVLNHPPIAVAGADRVVAPGDVVSFDASDSSDSDGRVRASLWDFGDEAEAKGRSARHAYETPGRYTVTVQVTDDSGGPCATATDTLEVWVNESPEAVPRHPDRGAIGETLAFDAGGSRDADGALTAYAWDFGDGHGAEGARVEHAYDASGTYTVRLTVTDDAGVGNSTTFATRELFVNEPPVAEAGEDREVAIAEPFELDGGGSEDSDGTLVRYAWDFGDGSTAEGQRVGHEYAEAGRFEVRLEVRDDSKTASDSHADTLLVVVNDPPVAEAGPDQRVTTSVVAFDGGGSTDSDGEIVRYAWSFGDGRAGEGRTVSHVYAAPGTYEVELRVTDDSPTPRNSADDRLQVVVNARPIADAGSDRKVAVGQRVEFSAAASQDPDGTIARSEWDFGDGTTEEGETVAHTYAEPGTYVVRLSVYDDTGHAAAVDHDHVRVVVNQAPVARLPAPPRIAPGDLVVLDAGRSFDPDGGSLKHSWTVDGAPAGAEPRLEQRFERPGSYDVALVVEDESGTANAVAQVQATVHVNHRPVARAGPDRLTCEPVLRFDAATSTDADGDPLLFTWDFGDGTPPGHGREVTHVYAGSGTYPVELRVDDGTSLSNAEALGGLVVRVNGAPVARAGPDTTECAGEVVLFDGSASDDPDGDVLKYTWDFGDGASAGGSHPIHVYEEAGVYPVTLSVQDGSGLPCGSHRDRRIVRVAAAPVAVAGPDVETCAGTEVSFDGSASRDADGAIDRFSWDFGDGTRGSGATVSHRYSRPGRYQAVLTVEGAPVADCDNTDTDELTVVVAAAPQARIEAPDVAVPGAAIGFRAAGAVDGDVRWRWELGDGNTAEGPAAEHTYEEAGTYEVALVASDPASARCGETRVTHRLHVNRAPVADAGPDRRAAPGETIGFRASSSSDTDGVVTKYEWSFGDGGRAEGVDVYHAFEEPGQYEVTLRVVDDSTAANAAAEDRISVAVNAMPEVHIVSPEAACVGQEVVLDASGSVDPDGDRLTARWELGDGAVAEGFVASHRYERPGDYVATVRMDDGSETANAQARASVALRVNRPPEARGGADRTVCPDDPVVFDGTASRDLDGEIVSHTWTFPGGDVAREARVTHVFSEPGRFDVELAVTDDSASACATTLAPVRVLVNATPRAEPGPERRGFTGGAHDAMTFDGRASFDPDGQTLRHRWDFGDGATGEGPLVSHAYVRPGTYEVRLDVDDGTGLACGTGSASTTVVIEGRDPS